MPIARVVRLDDDGAIAMPLADPATTSFAIVEPPFEPAALADAAAATRGHALMVRAALAARERASARGRAPARDYRPRGHASSSARLLSALPIVSTSGWYPDFGFLVLIAWRLLRADAWPAWWAAPLGFVNDLIVGDPIGLSVALWTRDDAGPRPDRPPHDVARLLDRMGAGGAAHRCSPNALEWRVAGLTGRRVPFAHRCCRRS